MQRGQRLNQRVNTATTSKNNLDELVTQFMYPNRGDKGIQGELSNQFISPTTSHPIGQLKDRNEVHDMFQ